MKNKIIKIGLDLDGVILYNPARIIRPIVALIKKIFFKKKELKFYFPKSNFEKTLWRFFHKSSLFIAPGFQEIIELSQKNKIEVYIVTARYSFLKKDFENFIKKSKANVYFKGCFYNQKDEQPHLFKERMVKKLNLDYFVEDNWNIAQYLFFKLKKDKFHTKIFWIYNILDKRINYKYKFPGLKEAFNQIYSKQKLTIITDYFFPHWTGISKSFFTLNKYLNNYFNTTIITSKFDPKLKSLEIIDGSVVIRKKIQFKISRLHYSFLIVLEFIKRIFLTDIVLINSPCSNILFISIIAKLFNKKLLIFHQGDLILPRGNPLNWIIEKIFNTSTKLSFFMANKISTYTDDYAQNSKIMNSFIKKNTSLVLPIEIFKINKNQINKIPTFGFGGRFVEEKGFDILLNAICKIDNNTPIHFIFAGDKNITYENFFDKQKKLINKLKSKITFLGLLKNNQMSIFFKKIDFLIVPSRTDCFNLLQAEAMLENKPIIASNIPGLRYLVKTTGFGWLFENENQEDLKEKILFAINNKDKVTQNYINAKTILNNEENTKKIVDFIKN